MEVGREERCIYWWLTVKVTCTVENPTNVSTAKVDKLGVTKPWKLLQWEHDCRSMKYALRIHVLKTWSMMKWGLEKLYCGCYDLIDEFIQWSVSNLMGYWKVMDIYKAGCTSGDGSLGAYLLGYSLPCLSAPWSPWTEQFSFAILPTTSAISQPLKQGDCMIIDENLWDGKCSFSLSGLSSAFSFFFFLQ